jgi:hypothetical protein
MKKTDTRSKLQQNKDILYKGTWSPQNDSEWRNLVSNQWEFHRNVNKHGQPKHTGDTQEMSRQQK